MRRRRLAGSSHARKRRRATAAARPGPRRHRGPSARRGTRSAPACFARRRYGRGGRAPLGAGVGVDVRAHLLVLARTIGAGCAALTRFATRAGTTSIVKCGKVAALLAGEKQPLFSGSSSSSGSADSRSRDRSSSSSSGSSGTATAAAAAAAQQQQQQHCKQAEWGIHLPSEPPEKAHPGAAAAAEEELAAHAPARACHGLATLLPRARPPPRRALFHV